MDDNRRMTWCPRCQNEEFDDGAEYCRICGLSRYNTCEGTPVYNERGFQDDVEVHNNFGNARFCEYCGQMTLFFKEGFLDAYTDLRTKNGDINPYSEGYVSQSVPSQQVSSIQNLADDDSDLPF